MTIKPTCDKCKQDLDDFGALLFSPPDEKNNVKKFHLCKDCYNSLVQKLE